MLDPMAEFIEKIKTTIGKVRFTASKEDRDSLEFDLNDFNVCISGLEYDYDCRCVDYEKRRDAEYQIKKSSITTDAGMKRYLDSFFITEQSELDKTEALIKHWKRLHSGFQKIADHVKSNAIQEMADKKRNGF